MTYEYPDNPYSFGNTDRMDRIIKQEKEAIKRKEIEEELKNEKL